KLSTAISESLSPIQVPNDLIYLLNTWQRYGSDQLKLQNIRHTENKGTDQIPVTGIEITWHVSIPSKPNTSTSAPLVTLTCYPSPINTNTIPTQNEITPTMKQIFREIHQLGNT
ncbi:MAG: hypothetical protein AAF125_01235, partial [Chloroflexota bacterium]